MYVKMYLLCFYMLNFRNPEAEPKSLNLGSTINPSSTETIQESETTKNVTFTKNGKELHPFSCDNNLVIENCPFEEEPLEDYTSLSQCDDDPLDCDINTEMDNSEYHDG